MRTIVEFIVGFVVLILLQVFMFDNIDIAGYVNAYVYIMFIIMLPMQATATTVMLLGFATGLIMDLLMGTSGLCAMVLTWVAFVRSSILSLTAGRDVVNVGGIPSAHTIGSVKFFSYVLLMTLSYNIPFFLFETMNPQEWVHTSLRITFSTIFTVIVIYFSHLILIRRA